MQIHFRSAYVLFFATIMLAGCSKSNRALPPVNAGDEGLVSPNCIPCNKTITVRTNSANVYDTAGARHNSGCLTFTGIWNPDSSYSAASILAKDKQYMATEHYDTAAFQTDYNYITLHNYYSLTDTFLAVHQDTLINRLYANSLISSTEKTYFNSLFAVANTYMKDTVPTQKMYDTACNHFIAVETAIIADGTLTTAQKQELLSTASIYRYSYAFWGTYILGQPAGGMVVGQGVRPFLFGIHISWKAVGLADASGAIAGGVGAAITGAGVVVGAIGGGIGASIARIFFKT